MTCNEVKGLVQGRRLSHCPPRHRPVISRLHYLDAMALPRVSHTRMLLMGDPGYLKAETCVPMDVLLWTVRVQSYLFYFVLYPNIRAWNVAHGRFSIHR